ncbi:MAG: DUF6800 family protein [Chloroflexota bacterium]
MRSQRDREIERRRQRREKLQVLKAKLAAATTSAERELLTQKIRRISPNALD